MALLFADGFEQYGAVASLAMAYTYATTNNTSLVTGRGGTGSALRLINAGGVDGTIQQALGNLATGYIGFAFKTGNLTDAARRIFELRDNATIQMCIQLNSDGQLHIMNGSTTTIGNSGDSRIRANIWYYIEVKFEIANSTTGTVELRVNEETWISVASGADTQVSSNAFVTNAYWTADDGLTADHYYDDIYICDTTGGVNDTYLGDMRVSPAFPNAVGNYTGSFTKSSAVDNYTLVDEATPDGAGSYVESSTAGHRDSYGFENLTATPAQVHAVILWSNAEKTDAGSRSFKLFTRISATDYDGDTHFPSQGDYQYFTQVWDQNPNSASAWTESTVNAFEGGIKVET